MNNLTRLFALCALVAATNAADSKESDPLAAQNHPDVLDKLAKNGLHPSIALGDHSIYNKESDVFRNVEFPEQVNEKSNPQWRKAVNEMFQQYRPKHHPLWQALKDSSASLLTNPGWLAEFYKRYQSAMHVTRVEVFKTPDLNTPNQRKRKIIIYQDDDGPKNRSHHDDLQRLFQDFGGNPVMPADWFGNPEDLIPELDQRTGDFIRGVQRLYPASTGAWTLAELLSDEWLSTLADGFSHVHPWVAKHDYFDEIFTGHVEIVHMMETVSLTEEVLYKKPHKLDITIQHAREMCELLNGLWDNLHDLVKNPQQFLSAPASKKTEL